MKTMKLRTLQQPSRLEAQLESLVKSQNWVPADAPRVTDRSELPSVLQKLAAKTVKAGGAWWAWSSYDGIRFFVTEMSLELSRERGSPALKVSYYNDQGKLQQYSHCVRLADGTWQRFSF
jgi:hypothetical protein